MLRPSLDKDMNLPEAFEIPKDMLKEGLENNGDMP